jgi:hypothetical protein
MTERKTQFTHSTFSTDIKIDKLGVVAPISEKIFFSLLIYGFGSEKMELELSIFAHTEAL